MPNIFVKEFIFSSMRDHKTGIFLVTSIEHPELSAHGWSLYKATDKLQEQIEQKVNKYWS